MQGPTGLVAEFLTHRLVLDSGGYIVQGKTGYGDPQEGIYIGNDGGVGKINAGGTGTYFKYTGSGIESTGDFKTSSTVGTTKGVHLDVSNNELYFYGETGNHIFSPGSCTIDVNISGTHGTITATGSPFISDAFRVGRSFTITGTVDNNGTYSIGAVSADGNILTTAQLIAGTDGTKTPTITLTSIIEKLGSIGIVSSGSDTIIANFGSVVSKYIAMQARTSSSSCPTIFGINDIGPAIVGYCGTSPFYSTGATKAGIQGLSTEYIGVYGYSDENYGGFFSCDSSTGLAPIKLDPDNAATAPAHSADAGAIWVTSDAKLYVNYGTTNWHCFSNQPLHDISQLAVTDGNIIVGNGTTWVAESGATARTSLGLGTGDTVDFTALHATTTLTDHIGEHTTSHNLVIDNNTVLLNNNQLFGYTVGGVAKALIGLLSDDTIYVGYSTQNVNIGNTATQNDPIYIKVGGANSQNITAGANDSGGAGYRLLRVPNA